MVLAVRLLGSGMVAITIPVGSDFRTALKRRRVCRRFADLIRSLLPTVQVPPTTEFVMVAKAGSCVSSTSPSRAPERERLRIRNPCGTSR